MAGFFAGVFFAAALAGFFFSAPFLPKIASYPSPNFLSSARPCRTMLTVVSAWCVVVWDALWISVIRDRRAGKWGEFRAAR